MTLSFEATEPKATWVFVNKDTGNLEVPGAGNSSTATIIRGIKGRITELSVRVQTYDNPAYKDTQKLLVVFDCNGEKVIVQTGLLTYLSKWLVYLVSNNRFDFNKEISFFTSKKEGIPVVVGRIYQDGVNKDIDPEARKAFPKIGDKKQTKIDWSAVLGSDDMEVVVVHANNHLQSFKADTYVETVVLSDEPEPEPEPKPNQQESLIEIPF